MMRYLRLWASFVKASWMADFEYRLNITLRILGELIWYVTQLSVFEVLYLHTQSISGWSVQAMRVFMGSLFAVESCYLFFFSEGMDSINSLVRKGDLDLYLVKPVSSQFMVTMRRTSVAYTVDLLIILVYLRWAIGGLPHAVTGAMLLGYVFLLLCGLAIYYSVRFMFVTLSIFLHDAGNIQFVWHQLYRLATRPDRIYPYYLRIFVLTLLPVAFFASVPAQILIEGPSWELLSAAPVLAVFLFWLSHVIWEAALKKYASASS